MGQPVSQAGCPSPSTDFEGEKLCLQVLLL